LVDNGGTLRILYIAPVPPPITGQPLACEVLLAALKKSHSVDTVNLSKTGLANGADSVHRVLEIAHILWQVFRMQRHADLVYFNISESRAGNAKDLLVYLLCIGKLDRMLIHMHGGAGMYTLLPERGGIRVRLNEWVFRRLGGVVSLGPRLSPIFEKRVQRERLHEVPNFAPDALFCPRDTVDQKFEDTRPLRVLFLSNLLAGKGYLELVEAISLLTPVERSQMEFHFAGGFEQPSDESQFRTAIAPYPEVTYHGVVHGEQKVKLFRNAHLFCLPTYYPYEGQPISILEAYASGCAVLTTDHSGILDVFTPDVSGLEVKARSASSIVEALRVAARQPDRLHRMAAHNRDAADRLYRSEEFTTRMRLLCESIGLARRP
jgi:glycosyltransferase involved in cell wall biosynthesis